MITITKCSGSNCNVKQSCQRYEPDERELWKATGIIPIIPTKQQDDCKYFVYDYEFEA